MESTMKRFEETIPDSIEGMKYEKFRHLNNILHIDNTPYREAQQAYYDVLWNDMKEEEKQEIHYAIRFLIEEDKVAVNTILWFLNYKFTKIEVIIDELLEGLNFPVTVYDAIKKISKVDYNKSLYAVLTKQKQQDAKGINIEKEICLFIKSDDPIIRRAEKIHIFISTLKNSMEVGDMLEFQEGDIG